MERLLKYNLQFFAQEGSGGEKTEDATSKKLTDARKEGQVAKSTDLITASALLTLFLALKMFVGYIGNSFLESFTDVYNRMDVIVKSEFTITVAATLLKDEILRIILVSLPVFLSAYFVCFVVNIAQVRWVITGKPLQPKFSKFNPIKGFHKMFSKDKLVELLKEVIKVFVICYISYGDIMKQQDLLLGLYDYELFPAVFIVGNAVIDLGMKISFVFLFVGFADYFYQKLKFKNDMRMTKQEIKDEYKQQEGDPQIKGKIKNKMREASQRRMMQQLPEADVVITNPTHFAAAIKYDKDSQSAPILLAKGADFLAEKIKDIAKENKISIIENKPLARMLYYNVEVGNEIPPELYQMTAEVLAYVYNLKQK